MHISKKKFFLFQNSNFDLSEISLSQQTSSNCFYLTMFAEKEISIQKSELNFWHWKLLSCPGKKL